MTCILNPFDSSCDSTPFLVLRDGITIWSNNTYEFDFYSSPFVIDSENRLVISTRGGNGISHSYTDTFDLETGKWIALTAFPEAQVRKGWIVMGQGKSD